MRVSILWLRAEGNELTRREYAQLKDIRKSPSTLEEPDELCGQALKVIIKLASKSFFSGSDLGGKETTDRH
jgi:hypothetical protein